MPPNYNKKSLKSHDQDLKIYNRMQITITNHTPISCEVYYGTYVSRFFDSESLSYFPPSQVLTQWYILWK